MMDFKRIWYSFRLLTLPSGVKRTAYLKKKNVFGAIGDKVMIQSRKVPLYPELIFFGNNVRVASNVTFVTHDVVHNMLNNLPKPLGGGTSLLRKKDKSLSATMFLSAQTARLCTM